MLKDSVTGKEVYTPREIKRVTSEYLINLLRNKEPVGKYIEIVRNKESLHYERMKEKIPNDIEELPVECFFKTLEKLKKKPGNKYDFITKSGNGLIHAF